MKWFFQAIRKYAVFSGRARRREYWWFTLIYIALYFALFVFDYQRIAVPGETFQQATKRMEGQFGVATVFSWALLLPSLGVGVRRLHDSNRSGWWLLMPMAPLIASIIAGFVMGSMSGATEGSPDLGVFLLITMVLSLLMLCGGLVLLVFMCLDGTPGPNRFGEDPKGRGETRSEDDVWPELA